MGSPRKPIEEHVRNGTYREDRHGPLPGASLPVGDEPVERLVKPDSLGGRAAEVWADLTGLLGGVVRRRDVPALVELCRWVERSERIAKELDAMEPTDREFKGLLISAGIATDKVAVLTARFGLSPADRARIKADRLAPVAPAKPKVKTRQPTKLDAAGGPK